MDGEHKDELAWLLENGMPASEIQRLQQEGMTTAQIAAAAKRLVA